jgi:hypothetical protein
MHLLALAGLTPGVALNLPKLATMPLPVFDAKLPKWYRCDAKNNNNKQTTDKQEKDPCRNKSPTTSFLFTLYVNFT